MIEDTANFPCRSLVSSVDRGRRLEKLYNQSSIFVIGDAKSSQNNPITKQYSQFFLALVIDTTNDEIIDSECSSTIQLTNQFMRSLFIGCKVYDNVEEAIDKRYHGASQKALIVAFRDAKIKYEQAKAALTTLS